MTVTMPPGSLAVTASSASWANAAVLLMGDSGSGKTSAAIAAAIECYEKTGKLTRLYVYDDGGYGDLAVALIQLGIVQVWKVTTRDPDGSLKLALGTIPLACQGYWPLERDPLTGWTAPGCRLVAPAALTYELRCPKCNALVASKSTSQELQQQVPCMSCSIPVSLLNGTVSRTMALTPGFETIGLHIHDGLSKMADWAGTDMNFRAAKDELGGIAGTTRTQVSDGLLFGSTGMSGVGFIQNRVSEWIRGSLSVPGMVRPPIFTALKKRTLDEGKTGVPVYGPELVGNALTHKVPSWFGVVGGCEMVGGKYTLHLTRYNDPGAQGGAAVPVLAHTRVAPGQLPAFLEDPPGATIENGKAFTKFSVGHVFELLAQAEQKTLATIAARFKSAPGIGSGRLPKEAEKAVRVSVDPMTSMAGMAPLPPGMVMGVGAPAAPSAPGAPLPPAFPAPGVAAPPLPPGFTPAAVSGPPPGPAAPAAPAAPSAPPPAPQPPVAPAPAGAPAGAPAQSAPAAPIPGVQSAPAAAALSPAAPAPPAAAASQPPQLGRPPSARPVPQGAAGQAQVAPVAAPISVPVALPGVSPGAPAVKKP